MRTGILGGTFDPIHNGHLAIAHTALAHADIDRVLFVPNRTPPHKPAPHAAESQRVAMLTQALAAYPDYTWSDVELRRDGPSYTIDTLRQLSAPAQQLVLILGSDAAALLPQWYQAQALADYCTVAVLTRHDAAFDGQALAHALPNLHVRVIQWAGIDVSSSEIRQRCQHNLPITHLVPAPVASYIAQYHLYRSMA